MEWQLPGRLVDMVSYHHAPLDVTDTENRRDACILNLADIMVYFLKLGNSGEPGVPELHPEVPKHVKLPKDAIDKIRKEVVEEVDETMKMFL